MTLSIPAVLRSRKRRAFAASRV
jgi:GABA permease